MATRNSGSSRKAANTSPMIRLVGASIAFAFGRSMVTSSTAPRRSVSMGLVINSSFRSQLPHPDQRVDGDRALAWRKHEQGIDVELLDLFCMGRGKRSDRLDC